MVRAVMSGYDENDMHNLFQAQRNKLRSGIVFVVCAAAVIAMLIITLIYDYSNILLKIPICVAAGIGIAAICGQPKDDLNSYPEVFRTGTILFSFSNSDFRVAASNMENIGKDDTDYKMNFYIFVPKITYIVRKDSIIDGTPEELSGILHTYVQKDYKYVGK